MSAFILPRAQFSEIKTGIDRLQQENGYDTTRRTLSRLLMTREYSTEKLVREWLSLNIDAVKQRYATQDLTGYEIAHDFDLTGGASTERMTPPSLLKHLHCLRYQMSEGNVPETDGYKDLEALIRTLADDIAENTLDYKTTPWGNAINDTL